MLDYFVSIWCYKLNMNLKLPPLDIKDFKIKMI